MSGVSAVTVVRWSPSPNWNQRDGRFPLRGDVSHRIVGSAPSALAKFAQPGTASSHFVIGHTQIGDPCPQCGPITTARGPLVIWQCVNLALMAWTNGDVRDPTWPGYQAGVNPNLTTITTEHEDMGKVGRHIVTDHIWQASIELKRLLRSGNLTAIRAAGIRVGDGAFSAASLVARMAALPINDTTYIDHHQIAGANKPWCWRDFDGDKGFPSRLPGLLASLQDAPTRIPTLADLSYFKPNTGMVKASAPFYAEPGGGEVGKLAGGPIVVLGEKPAGRPDWFQVFVGVRETDAGTALGVVSPDRIGWVRRADVTVDATPINLPFVQRVARAVYTDDPIGVPELTQLQEALDSANKRTAAVKTAGAAALRKAKAVEEAHAAALETSAKSIEAM